MHSSNQFIQSSLNDTPNKQTMTKQDFRPPKETLTQKKKQFWRRMNEKDTAIKLLEEKNDKIYRQIKAIERIILEREKEREELAKQAKKRSQVIQLNDNPEVLNRELNNCYKKIKLYEYELQRLKNRTQSSQSLAEKVIQLEDELKQKKSIQEKLRHSLHELTKEFKDRSKKLTGNHQQIEIQKKLKSKNDELKVVQEMVKDYENRQSIKEKNLKTQYNFIKKLEQKFLEDGGSLHQIDQIKERAVKTFQEGRMVKTAKQSQTDAFTGPNSQNGQPHLVEDRTKDRFFELLNQFKVLEKLNKKYDKQLQQSESGLKQLQSRNQLQRMKLEKLNNQLEELESSIKVKKGCILATNLKPKKYSGLQPISNRSNSLYDPFDNKTRAKLEELKKAKRVSHQNVRHNISLNNMNGSSHKMDKMEVI